MNYIGNSKLRHMADIDFKDGSGWAAVHYAVINKNQPFLEFLLANGADIGLRGKGGLTAIFLAIIR
jgi:ankyrin repeat protein